MKLSLLILLASSLTLGAQSNSKWNFGFHVGVNSSLINTGANDYSVDNGNSFNVKPGFSFAGGLNAEYMFNKRFTVHTGVQFQTAKSKWIYQFLSLNNSPVSETRVNFVNQYINVPTVVMYSMISKDRFNFSVGVGSTFQLRLRSLVKATAISYDFDQNTTGVVSSPSIILTEFSNFLLVSPTLQIAADLKLRHLQKLRFLASYSFSLNDPLPSRDTPPEVIYNHGVRFGHSKLQTISASIQYFWRGLHPNKN